MQQPKIYLYKRIVQAKLFIDANYFAQLNAGNIANEAFFSKFHFIRLFKKIYGKTPHQYLVKVRIQQALLLLQSGLPVTEACSAVGFENPASFSTLFKRVTGTTPSAFVARDKAREIAITAAPLKFIPGCFAARLLPEKRAIFNK